jgi:hypothetical protein
MQYINLSEHMRHIPIEQLTNLKFRKSPYFHKYIMNIPINENGVLPATWYSDTLYIKPIRSDTPQILQNSSENQSHKNVFFEEMYAPYHQLIIEKGKIISANKIVPIKRAL